jgi:hypothetical protein
MTRRKKGGTMAQVSTIMTMIGTGLAIIGSMFGMVRWLRASVSRDSDLKIDGLGQQMGARIDAVDVKIDGVEQRLSERVAFGINLTDVRLKALEEDMSLIKQHLLGRQLAA